MTKPKWIRGKALITAKALRLFQPGDKFRCSVCERIHVFEGWNNLDNKLINIERGAMLLDEVVGWRPRQ